MSVQYFEDVNQKGNVIVKKELGTFYLEYISKINPVWKATAPNSSYEREYYLGQGNTCLFDITEAEALERIATWIDAKQK